jgi:hypothetical protein
MPVINEAYPIAETRELNAFVEIERKRIRTHPFNLSKGTKRKFFVLDRISSQLHIKEAKECEVGRSKPGIRNALPYSSFRKICKNTCAKIAECAKERVSALLDRGEPFKDGPLAIPHDEAAKPKEEKKPRKLKGERPDEKDNPSPAGFDLHKSKGLLKLSETGINIDITRPLPSVHKVTHERLLFHFSRITSGEEPFIIFE